MKSRLLALALTASMAGSLLTACGDSSDDSDNSGMIGNLISTGDEEETEGENGTEPTTAEKIHGKGESVSPKTEPTTEKNTISVPQKPGDADEITIDPTDMVGMTLPEITSLFGDYDIASDEVTGYYYLYNYEKMPGATFHFVDHTWDNMWDGVDLAAGKYEDLRRKVASSSARITKINCREGMIDEFKAGMSYRKCAEIIGDFPTTGSNNGATFCGAPASVAYYYLHGNRNCVVALHFELKGQLDRDLNEGKFSTSNCSDILPEDMKKYDPVLQNIEVIYAPDRTNSAAKITVSSQLNDITDNGKTFTYGPKNLIDGDMMTCWCEGKNDTGIGETVKYTSPDLLDIGFVTVFGGLRSNPEAFYKNCRPARMNIGPDGIVMEYTLQTYYSNNYIRAIPVGYVAADTYSFTVIDVDTSYSKYNDTCISEIRFNGYSDNMH